MSFDLNGLLQQYLNPAASANADNVAGDFDKIAETVPRDTVAAGVTEALRSDQTAPFPQLLSQLFGRSDPEQRAGMLNQLLGGLNPALVSSLVSGILGSLVQGGNKISAEQAARVSPETVEKLAGRVEQHNPNVVDKMGEFYAQHSTLIKALGGAALTIALSRIAQTQSNK